MKSIKLVLTLIFIALNSPLNAQNPSDLGSTKPFMVGLKGTIYKLIRPTKAELDKNKNNYIGMIEKTKPIGYVYTQSLKISERNLTDSFPGVPKDITEFAIIYKGKFPVKEAEMYGFALKSDDGSRLWIDSIEVINHDGLHDFSSTKIGSIKLNKGFHDIKVWYYQGLATRMGLLLLMKKAVDKTWFPFDLKPLEDEIKQLIKVDSGVAKVQLNEQFLFDLGKSELKPEAASQLSNIAKLLIVNPNALLKIEGHTDNKGAAKANQLLSENRAIAVAKALKLMGIPENVRIETKGFGFSQPIAPNSTEEGKAKNRRVEISISTN
jgi:outer membrane protein OmpA-like peptidoglycan-associated protein